MKLRSVFFMFLLLHMVFVPIKLLNQMENNADVAVQGKVVNLVATFDGFKFYLADRNNRVILVKPPKGVKNYLRNGDIVVVYGNLIKGTTKNDNYIAARRVSFGEAL